MPLNWTRATWWLCAALCALHVVAFFAVALARLRYPYDLEWMEGGQLVQSYEILSGRFPYRAPSADYIPFPYQPFYSAVVAALGWVFGLSLPLARSVSIAATTACVALVGWAVSRETSSGAYGWLAGATVFALYRVFNFWFDLARVDSLFMALLVGALFAGRYIKGAWRSCLASAVLFVLAYETKQLALPFFVLVPPLLWAKDRRAALAFVPLVFLLLAIDFWLSQRASGGWFGFYVNDVPRAQPYQVDRFIRFPWIVASRVPVLAALAGAGILRALRGRSWTAKLRETWSLATILGTAVTLAAWARPGGYANNLVTTYIFALIPAFVELHRRASVASGRAANTRATSARPLCLFSALALQLAALGYNPASQIPRAADYAAGRQFVEAIRAIDGPVLVPQRPWLAVLAGKRPCYHANAYWEMAFRRGADPAPEDLHRRLDDGFYRAVVVDVDPRTVPTPARTLPEEMARNYVCDRKLSLPGRGLETFAGAGGTAPRLVCRYAPATP
jgi:hypothetical protein